MGLLQERCKEFSRKYDDVEKWQQVMTWQTRHKDLA